MFIAPHERARFHQLCQRQKPGKSDEIFVRNLYELAERCEFGTQKGENIRDRLGVGINDKELSENLQLKSDLDLETAIQMVRQSEVVKSQIKDQSATDRELDEVTSRHGDRRRKFNKSSWTGSSTNKWYDKPQSQYTD